MLTGRSRNSTVEPKLMHTGQAGLFTGANSLRLTGELLKYPRWNVFRISASPISARSLIPAAIDPAHIAIPPESVGQMRAISRSFFSLISPLRYTSHIHDHESDQFHL